MDDRHKNRNNKLLILCGATIWWPITFKPRKFSSKRCGIYSRVICVTGNILHPEAAIDSGV
jgi:hypothetical protein